MRAQSAPKALLDFWAELSVTIYQEPFELSRKKGDAMLDLVKSVIGDAWMTSGLVVKANKRSNRNPKKVEGLGFRVSTPLQQGPKCRYSSAGSLFQES